jgi:hypothetical protein
MPTRRDLSLGAEGRRSLIAPRLARATFSVRLGAVFPERLKDRSAARAGAVKTGRRPVSMVERLMAEPTYSIGPHCCSSSRL